jgi:hypothetical protein
MRTHVVQLAVAMGDEGSGRHLFSLCEPALKRRTSNVIIVPIYRALQALESVIPQGRKRMMLKSKLARSPAPPAIRPDPAPGRAIIFGKD